MSKAPRISLYTLNPFFYIQTRKLFLWFIIIGCIVAVQILQIDWLTPVVILKSREDFEFVDPIYENLCNLIVLTICLALLNKQAKIRKINTQQIIGKLPNNFQWLPIVILASFKVVFSYGIYRVFNYPLSFIVPQWMETNLAQSFFSDPLESTLPTLCFVFSFFTSISSELFVTLVIYGIILHRWAFKWGNAKAVLGIGLLHGIAAYTNFINGFITGVIVCLLYIKTRTLIVPMVFRIISMLISLTLEVYHFFVVQSNSDNVLQQFQSEFKLGIILFSISTPYIIWWLHKNWLNKNEELPYFANEQCFADKA